MSLTLFRDPFTSYTRSDPLSYLDRLWGEMDRAFGLVRRDPARTRDPAQQLWSSSCDLTETDDHFILKADLPGAKKEDVQVQIEQGVLTVKAHREEKTEHTDVYRHHMERSVGTFHRSFTLPSEVDPSQVTASMQDGVLELCIPKPKPKKKKESETVHVQVA